MMHSSMPREGGAPPGSAPPAGAPSPSVEPGASEASEARAGDVLRAARRAGRQLYLAGPEGHFLGFGRSLEGLGLSAQVSPPYLPYISPTSPLYLSASRHRPSSTLKALACTSARSLRLTHLRRAAGP